MGATWIFMLQPARSGGIAGAERRYPPVRSDSLAAALRAVAAETGILAEAFGGPAPPFILSSLFVEAGGVRLYPRPLAEPAAFAGLDPLEAEHLRAVWSGFELVTEGRLESLAEGRRVRFELEDIIEDRAWGMPSERGLRDLPRRGISAGISVDRSGGGVGRFARERWILSEGSRLFFLARLEDPRHLAALKELAARLGEAGLGAGRSAGWGKFDVAGAWPAPAFLARGPIDSCEAAAAPASPAGLSSPAGLPAPAVSRPALLLSLCLPSREDVERGALDGMRGGTELRAGWIHSGGPTEMRKRPVRMLVEGTVLSAAGGGIAGEVRDVRPGGFEGHPVWRDGRALAIAYGGMS